MRKEFGGMNLNALLGQERLKSSENLSYAF
jgi:hypothetical protein